mgnify:CR=1 FL=1
MKKKILFLSLLISLTSLCGCKYDEKEEKIIQQTPYRIVNNEGNKSTIVDANGAPVVVCSTLFRTDIFLNFDKITVSDLDDYFALSKATGFNYVDVPFMWSQLELAEDVYSFDDINTYLDMAKKYDLKLNLIWYGSFVDGQCNTVNIPEYISSDHETYPIIKYCFANACFGDCVIMNWAGKALLERESKAVKQLLAYVAAWNDLNDRYNPVTMFQCGQGIDRLQRYRVDDFNLIYENLMTIVQAKKMVREYVSAISKAAKRSVYCPITRVEFCEQSSVTNYVSDIKNIKTVDMVCTTYLESLSLVKQGFKNFSDRFGDVMPVMDVENFATDTNDSNALVSYAVGGSGFTTYNLSSPLYYPLQTLRGVMYLRKDFTKTTLEEKFTQVNTRATDMKEVNEFVQKASVAVATTKKENFALFGFDRAAISSGDGTQKVYLGAPNEEGLLVDYRANTKKSYAYTMYTNGAVYLLSKSSGTIKIKNCHLFRATTGSFDQNGFWNKNEEVTIDEDTINFEANKLYRIKINDVEELPNATKVAELGYKSTYSAIVERYV